MRTGTQPLLATALLWAGSGYAEDVGPKRSLQAVPRVGLGFPEVPIAMDGPIAEEVIDALEQDSQVTVMGTVELGGLLCDTLSDAVDATELTFALSSTEIVTAARSSFVTIPGDSFDDGIGRMIWSGTVFDPPAGPEEATNRTVTMTWADECTIETFILRVVQEFTDGTNSVRKSVPCEAGSDTDLCLVEVSIEFMEEMEIEIPTTTSADSSISISPVERRLRGADGQERELQAGTSTISVMYLYTPEALEVLGNVSVTQMVSFLADGFATANEGLANSEVDAEFAPVFFGLSPFPQGDSMITALQTMRTNPDVLEMRETYEADLVQLVGAFDDFCGVAFVFNGDADFAFSVAAPNCFYQFTHTHEFGHNLGCFHNRENSNIDTLFAHGFRSCDGVIPYRTIMSVACNDAPRINYFSNPDVPYLGIFPTGGETENNALAITMNMATVADYRPLQPTPAPTPAPVVTLPPTIPPNTIPPTLPPNTIPPTSATSPTSTDGFMFLECYVDSSANRVLSGPSVKGNQMMTTELCAELCEGFNFFGTEFSSECFCGLASDEPGELGLATNCDRACTGDPTQTCGGANAISVYEFTNPPLITSTPLGCYTDMVSARIMDFGFSSSSAMTNEACAVFCNGSTYFGTQFARECFCGDADTDFTVHGPSEACNMACTGDADQICGGRNAMNVHEY